jgi:hypothetical protein
MKKFYVIKNEKGEVLLKLPALVYSDADIKFIVQYTKGTTLEEVWES